MRNALCFAVTLLAAGLALDAGRLAVGRDPVLPSLVSGSIKYSPRPKQKFKFVCSRPGIEGFDPASDAVSATIGSISGTFGPSIAAGAAGWKGRNGKYSIKGDGWKLKIDAANGLVAFTMKTDNGGMFENPITVHVDVGGILADLERTWTASPKKAGCFTWP